MQQKSSSSVTITNPASSSVNKKFYNVGLKHLEKSESSVFMLSELVQQMQDFCLSIMPW